MIKYQVLFLEFFIFLSLRADDYPNSPSGAPTITVGGASKNGRIEISGDEDLFKVTLTGGVSYTVVNQAASGSDPEIYVRGPSPSTTQIAYNDDHDELSAQVIFTAPTSGTYFIVSAGYKATTGPYSLRIFLTIPCPTNCGRNQFHSLKNF